MTKQGTHNLHPLGADVMDLDALLERRTLRPASVRLGRKTYSVRTDLTGAQTAQFVSLIGQQKDLEAFALLVGAKDAVTLNAHIDALPRMHQALVSSRIMHASKVLAQYAKSEADIYAEYGYEIESEVDSVEQGESTAS